MKFNSSFTNKKTFIVAALICSTNIAFSQVEVSPLTNTSLSTSTDVVASSETAQKKQIKQAISKLNELAPEKRAALEELPLAKTTFTVIDQLVAASLQEEALINKVEVFINAKKAAGLEVAALEARLQLSKDALESANISISIASSLTEGWASTLSTSTYKSAVTLKRNEYRLSLGNARQNIQKTNDLLLEILFSFSKPSADVTTPQLPPGGNEATSTTAGGTISSSLTSSISSSTQVASSGAGQAVRPQTIPKTLKMLEQ